MKNSISNETLLTLLGDDDVSVSVPAIKLALEQQDLPDFIKDHQDDGDPILRKHIQQLNAVSKLDHRLAAVTEKLQKQSISFWELLIQLNLVFDQRHSPESLNDFLQNFFQSIKLKTLSAENLRKTIQSMSLEIPEFRDMFNIETFFPSEVISQKSGNTLIWCELFRQFALQNNWNATIVIYMGQFKLLLPDHKLLNPDDNWNILQLKPGLYYVCSEQEIINSYLALLFSACVIDNQPYDLCTFAPIMLKLCKATLADMPFPLGNVRQQPFA